MTLWVPGWLPDPATLRLDQQAELVDDIKVKTQVVLERASVYASELGRTTFPFSGDATAIAGWLDVFAGLEEPDVFVPLFSIWDHFGLRRDGYHRKWAVVGDEPERIAAQRREYARWPALVWHTEVRGAAAWYWFSRAFPDARLEVTTTTVNILLGEYVEKEVRGVVYMTSPKLLFPISFIANSLEMDIWANLRNKILGLPEGNFGVSVESFDLGLCRESGHWNWSLTVDVVRRAGESDEGFEERFKRVPDVLVEELGRLERVREVVREDRDLIMLSVKGRSKIVKDIREMIGRVGGVLEGLTVDPDVEDNR